MRIRVLGGLCLTLLLGNPLAAQVPEVDFGLVVEAQPADAMLRGATDDQDRVGNYDWMSGWTQAVAYQVQKQSRFLVLREQGQSEHGNNVHIYDMRADGSFGNLQTASHWGEGWTRVVSYPLKDSVYFLLLRRQGLTEDGFNVQIRREDTIVAQYTWTPGWTQAVPYVIQERPYLLFLKEKGYDEDDNNVRLHRIEPNGTLGERVAQYQWSEGWSTAACYQVAGKSYLFLLKREGTDAEGNNVRILQFQDDGKLTLVPTASYAWKAGWTQAIPYVVNERPYLFCLREQGYDEDNKNVQIFCLAKEGTLGDVLVNYHWTEGWTTATIYRAEESLCLLLVKREGAGLDGHNVHIHRIEDNGRIH